MDRIMPIDLERPELRKKFRGYDCVSVDRLTNGAAKTLQEVLMENATLRQELERLRGEVGVVRQQEQSLKEVLIVAQRAAEETRAVAHREAEATLEEARLGAMGERMANLQKLSETRWELDQLRADRMRYADDYRALLERHQREISQIVGLEVIEGEGGMREAS